MKILAIEFSSELRSVAVAESQSGSSHVLGFTSETGGRSTRAIALIEQALQQAKVEQKEIECLAIGVGPGSYTGIRAAIALAQGWKLAREMRLLAISSVECLALQAQAEKLFGKVTMVIDAQRNEFYLASYEISQTGRKEMEPLRLSTKAEVQKRLEREEIVIGPEITVAFHGKQNFFPSAMALAQLAADRDDFVSAEKLEPIYLRETSFVKAPIPRSIKESTNDFTADTQGKCE